MVTNINSTIDITVLKSFDIKPFKIKLNHAIVKNQEIVKFVCLKEIKTSYSTTIRDLIASHWSDN